MTTETKRHKRGDVREDGMVFLNYNPSCSNGEIWGTHSQLEELRSRNRVQRAAHYVANSESIKEAQRNKYAADPEFRERILQGKRELRNNPSFVEHRREYENKRRKLPHRKKAIAKYYVDRRKADALFALKGRIRTRLGHALRGAGYTKRSKTFDIVGCAAEELKARIESRFLNGMSWENRHLWHIDHEIPLASAKTEEELLALCHYTNLQPLWAEDNLKKSDKILN